ncbi:MAG: cysteine dioxygenase family protein [Planctomycetes bacterium]|nr:cysteine dioxygenase family protein [Planctomycetota bacterium]
MPSTASGKDIQAWIKGLEALACPDQAEFAERVTAYIRRSIVSRESLEPYSFFELDHYTRNLIYKSELFEVMALCWQAGQMSAIHNHRDQQCWMLMADGQLENINYRVLNRDPVAQTCDLEPTGTQLITRSSPLAVEDESPVHRIVNCPHLGARALSVHVYSRPFDICEVYCPDSGTYKDIQLSYWSEYGKLVGNHVDPCAEDGEPQQDPCEEA